MLSIGLWGCATTPSESFNAKARQAGLSRSVIPGQQFDHAVYWNRAALRMTAEDGDGKVLHVYFDGDGTLLDIDKDGKVHPTADPTLRGRRLGGRPLTLNLIARDRQPSILLGRPCFDGLAESRNCGPAYWTAARYSEPVVASIASALQSLRTQSKADAVVLFGVSGGGALAVLVADRVDFIDGIITVAANLDRDAWLAYHAYPVSTESLNPATDGRRHAAQHRNVFERHYSGGRDTVVPTSTVTRGLRAPEELVVIPDYDHDCCWADIWPQILADIPDLQGRAQGASAAP